MKEIKEIIKEDWGEHAGSPQLISVHPNEWQVRIN